MHLPPPIKLPERNIITPFVFVTDDAFLLSKNIMKPFPGAQIKGSNQKIFNYRLNKARRVSECHILRKPMLLESERAKKVVLAILHLHNFLKKSQSIAIYNPFGTFD